MALMSPPLHHSFPFLPTLYRRSIPPSLSGVDDERRVLAGREGSVLVAPQPVPLSRAEAADQAEVQGKVGRAALRGAGRAHRGPSVRPSVSQSVVSQ